MTKPQLLLESTDGFGSSLHSTFQFRSEELFFCNCTSQIDERLTVFQRFTAMSLKTSGTSAFAVDLARPHASSLPGHAHPQPIAGYVAGQTADRSATENTQKQVLTTNQSHTLLGVTTTGIRHRETPPRIPGRDTDPRGDRRIPHQYNLAICGPGAASAGCICSSCAVFGGQ